MISSTWIRAEALPAALVAVTVPPTARGRGNRPVVLIYPDVGVVDQVNVGCVAIGLPNWSMRLAVNCCVVPSWRVADDGVITMPFAVGVTVTVDVVLVTDSP